MENAVRLEHFAQMRALENAYSSTNQTFVDHLLSGPDAERTRSELPLKRIQFDAAEVLADELEKVCGLLQCSKRQFLEGAVAEALDRAQQAYFATLEKVADSGGPQYSLTAEEA